MWFLRFIISITIMIVTWYFAMFVVGLYSGIVGSKTALLDPATIGVICCFVELSYLRVRE